MLLVRLPDELLNVERLALTGIERPEALVNLSPQLAQLLDVRQQTAANLLLIGSRQVRHFGDRLFENFDHDKPYYSIGTGIKVSDQPDVVQCSTRRPYGGDIALDGVGRSAPET
jgi:hypothetical protein